MSVSGEPPGEARTLHAAATHLTRIVGPRARARFGVQLRFVVSPGGCDAAVVAPGLTDLVWDLVSLLTPQHSLPA